MKILILLCVLSFAVLSWAEESRNSRGCVYIDGICDSECEVGTQSYTPGCDYLKPEPTCANPHPKIDKRGGRICDFSACYCAPPTVRNKCGKCVPLDECP